MNWKKILLALATVTALVAPGVAFAARTDALWDYIQGGNYTQPNGSANGTNILIQGINHYINFGTLTGTNGYGFRDNGGSIEFKNSGGVWAGIGSGGTTYTATYPILVTGSVISTAFGTTTNNTFAGTQTFNNVTINGTCTGCSSGSGITSIGPVGQSQTGANQTLATSSATTISGLTVGLTIVGNTNTQTFTPNFTGAISGLTTGAFSSANISQWTNNSNYITLASLSGTAPVRYNSSTGAFDFTGLATTSALSSSNVLTSNGLSGVYGTATSTLTPSSPLTGSFTQLGSGGALGINTSGTWSGNAGTATALAANGTNCSAGNYPLGVDASGNSEGCTAASTGTVTGVTATYPILSTGGTAPVISTAFGTTTSNTWAGTQTFTNQITGSISGNAGTATALATGRTISVSGDLTYTSPSFDGTGNVTAAGTLATVNSNTGSFGGVNSIPSFTVNGKGLITAAAGNTPSIPASEITSGTFGTGNYTFPADLLVTGNATSTAFFATTASTTKLWGANLQNCSGTNALTYTSGLFGCAAQPQGTVTAVSVASANGFAGTSGGGATPALTLSTTISGVLKGNGTAISAAANGTDYTLITAKTCTGSDFVSSVTAAGVFTCTTPSGTTYTGTYPIQVTGSVISSAFGTTTTIGIGNNLSLYTNSAGIIVGVATSSTSFSIGGNAGTATALQTGRTLSISGDLTYTSPTFDGTGNVTAAGTLATVNSNVGSFTNANITVNGKGLITAASNGTGGSGTGLSTSSPVAAGNLLEYSATGAGSAFGVATSTPTVSAPITYSGTLGSFVGGVAGAFGCTSASAGVTGCLTGTDWSTFNNKTSYGESWALDGSGFLSPTTTSLTVIVPTALQVGNTGASTLGGKLLINGGYNDVSSSLTMLSNSTARGTNIVMGLTNQRVAFGADNGTTRLIPSAANGDFSLALNTANSAFRISDFSSGATTTNFEFTKGTFNVGTTSALNALGVQGNGFFSGNLTGANITATGTLTLSPLATPAGSFLAVNASGQVIATTTPSSTGGTGVGTIATSSLETANEIPYFTTTSAYPARLSGSLDLQWDNTTHRLSLTSSSAVNAFIRSGAGLSLVGGGGSGGVLSLSGSDGVVGVSGGNGASAQLLGGTGVSAGTGNGGDVNINGGDGSATGTSGNGGVVQIVGGNGIGTNGNGGDVLLAGGTKTGSGTQGHVLIGDSILPNAVMDNSVMTADRTFSFPNETGTFALGTGSTGNCAQWSTTNTLTTTGSPCGSGSGSGAAAFTPTTWGASTTTVLGFINGFISNATSTITYLGTGGVAANNGRLYNAATSTVNAPLTYSASTNSFSLAKATRSVDGYLAGTDFTTFDNKISSTSLSVTTTGTSGAATYTPSTGVFNIPQYQAAGSYLTLGSLSATAPIRYNNSTGAFDFTGLATTTSLSSSNILTSNGLSGVYGTATSTLTPSGPLTGSFTQIGSGGTLGCTTAASGVAGCLSNTSFDTFNNKQAALTFTYPLVNTANTITGFGTTTNWGLGSNGLVMTGATGLPFSQATSSPVNINISGNAATVTTNANLSGVVTSSGNTTSFGSQSAGVLGSPATGNTAVQATSTLYGAVQNGKVLAGLGGVLAYVATSTDSCGTGVTCSYSGGVNSFSIANGAISDAMLASTFVKTLTVTSGQGVSGSFTAGATPALSLTLGALTGVTSFNGLVVTANTGTITTGVWNGTTIAIANGGTNATSFTTSGNGVYYDGTRLLTAPLTSSVTYPYASTTAITSSYASSTNAFFGTLNLPGISGTQCLHSIGGVVSGTGSDCGSGGGGSSFGEAWALDATKTFLIPTTTVGIIVSATSTIGSGTQQGGLTINGGATTTKNAAFLQSVVIGTSTGALGTVNANSGNLFLYNNNTAGASPAIVFGGNLGGDTDFWIGRQNQNDAANNDSLQIGAGLVPGVSPVMAWTYQGFEGIGSTTPFAKLSVHGNPNDPAMATTLFAVGSSTATATTTLFSISNVGQTIMQGLGLVINDIFGTQIFQVNTASTTGSIFTVAATTSPSLSSPIKLFDVDQYGHLTASSTGATPTLSCTPTNNGTLGTNTNDVTGDVTTGTLSTACTVTFAHAYAATPEIIVTGGSTASVVGVTSRSTTSFTIGLGTAATGDNISYFVIQP